MCLQLSSFVSLLSCQYNFRVQWSLHFVLFLSLSVQAGNVSVVIMPSKILWTSYESHWDSVLQTKATPRDTDRLDISPVLREDLQDINLFGWPFAWLNSTVINKLWFFWGLKKMFYSHTIGFVFRAHFPGSAQVIKPCLFTSRFLTSAWFAIWRGSEFSKPLSPGKSSFYLIVLPLIFFFS